MRLNKTEREEFPRKITIMIPTSWESIRKNQMKRLTNNSKGVSQRRHGRELDVSNETT